MADKSSSKGLKLALEQNPEFEEWIKVFAEYLRSRNNTMKQKNVDYSAIVSFSDLLKDKVFWPKLSDGPLNEYLVRPKDSLGRGVPASPDDIPRSDTTPLWLCNKKLHNGAIPVPEDLRWRCNDHIVGIWVWYAWYRMTSRLFPQCDPEFCPKFAVHGISDWGDAPALLKKFRPPMFHNDEEILEDARRSVDSGYDIAKNVAAALCEIGYENLQKQFGFSKLKYADWTIISLLDSKAFPQVASIERNLKSKASEAYRNHLRMIHDIVDYAADVVHGESRNARVQHDLSCSLTGCVWSEFNRLTAELAKIYGPEEMNLYLGSAYLWHLAAGRYHIMPKLCYAVRHCKVPTPTDCPWSGFPACRVFLDIPETPDPVPGPEVCRGPCLEISPWPKKSEDVPEILESAFRCMFDPNICYDCAMKAADHATGSIQQLQPTEWFEFCLRDISWVWERQIVLLYWKALGHMTGLVAPLGSHDEAPCLFS
ncbi:hypothetical protein TWF481_008671 [Arthrobotrys musiformis]|uniref:Uncharacterized protein n=1 Tax=Arthrobotrys musiformis TaxID=47236 RepID=A0AAV9WDL6_9PEZI